jgi:hypothetical protein
MDEPKELATQSHTNLEIMKEVLLIITDLTADNLLKTIRITDFKGITTKVGDKAVLAYLFFLHFIGLITINESNDITVVSRNGQFALRSLLEIVLETSKRPSIFDNDAFGDQYRVDFSRALENYRKLKLSGNSRPLNSRRIVNVLIKSKQIRKWKYQDVFLHVYDSKWQEYHLVGESQQLQNQSDIEIIQKALENHLELTPSDFILEPSFSKEIKSVFISKTNGVITEYTIVLKAVKSINKPLRLREIAEKNKGIQDYFRWFTLAEIECLEGFHGEKIMKTTREILESVNTKNIPECIKKAEDARKVPNFVEELGNRFSYKPFVILISILIISLLSSYSANIIQQLSPYKVIIDQITLIVDIITICMGVYQIIKGLTK